MDCGDKSNLRNINLLINDKWVAIQATDYLIAMRTEVNTVKMPTGMCSLCLKLSSDNDWHVGTAALIGYYAEFDFTNR